MLVFKFGGASVKDADGVVNLANVVKKFEGQELLLGCVGEPDVRGGQRVAGLGSLLHHYHSRLILYEQLTYAAKQKVDRRV